MSDKITKSRWPLKITALSIEQVLVGMPGSPTLEDLETQVLDDLSNVAPGDTIWKLFVESQREFEAPIQDVFFFKTEESANKAAARIKVGERYDGPLENEIRFRFELAYSDADTFLKAIIDPQKNSDSLKFSEETLVEAEIRTQEGHLAPAVMDWTGDEDIAWLKEVFGHGWTRVAVLQYCMNKYPFSSVVSLCAKLEVAVHIAKDDYTAGWIAREIRLAVGKLEATALYGAERQEDLAKAGEARKKKSVDANHARNDVIASLWHECKAEHGSETMRRDSNAAQAIHILANQLRPKELVVRSTGEVIGVEAIRKKLGSLRKLGKLG